VPHFAQNFAPSLFSVEHEEHFTYFSLCLFDSNVDSSLLLNGVHRKRRAGYIDRLVKEWCRITLLENGRRT
jgi:hypothetical protein